MTEKEKKAFRLLKNRVKVVGELADEALEKGGCRDALVRIKSVVSADVDELEEESGE